MNRFALAAFASVAALALASCGKSDGADEAANPDNVEMPAEETMNTVDAAATPVADPAATPGADAAAAPGDAAAGASPASSSSDAAAPAAK